MVFNPTHYQNLTYEQKVAHAKEMIASFLHLCEYQKPYIAFSGGKDSTVLRHLCLAVDPTLKCECVVEMFHPEVAKYIQRLGDVIIHKSKHSFESVLESGLPVISKKSAQMIEQYRNSKNRSTKYYADYIPNHLGKK
jgi:3'-phosphoadenosine 5'-phosphosulfate sulfotransferase (PAPS reductase)/FAD synthetase